MKKIKFLTLIILSIFVLSSCWNIESNISINNSKKIVALWDSLTIWYWLDKNDSYPSQLEVKLKENWYEYAIINWWISWNTSEQLLNRLSNYDDIKADIYLLNIWANDWLRKMDLNKMQWNIEKIIDYLNKVNPEWKIILFWTKLPIMFWIWYSRDFNSRFKDIVDKKLVFYYWYFLDWVNWNPKLNLNDGMHPNKDWYDIISKNILDYLMENNFIEKSS